MIDQNRDSLLELWNSVCETDPDHTKKVDQRGGFTCIDPQHQLHKATAEWGPYGSTWGLKEFEWGIIEVEGLKPTMTLDCVFWYPGGEFPISADMPFRHNDDCRKKLRTACQSKSLALLGFNADIFMGQYDDERYVQAMHTKFSDQDELRGQIIHAIAACTTAAKLKAVRKTLDERFEQNIINKTMWSEMVERCDQQAKELKKGPPPMSEEEKQAAIEQERQESFA